MSMQRINWNQFRLKNPNQREAFEELCYHLFCRRYLKTDGVRADYNQKGLETEPIKINGELIGFQAKFFDNKLSDPSSVKQINESIKKAKSAFPNLKCIILYTHQSFGVINPKYKRDIEKKAGTLKIDWIVKSNFNSLLNQPSNLDLTQLYFGQGDEFGFINESSSVDKTTLIKSSEFIDLSLEKGNQQRATDILQETQKAILVVGSPGSGKSVLMYRLFQLIGGLDRISERAMKSVISRNKILPMLINLKDCSSDSLENIIRNRKGDYGLQHANNSFKITYLFDGLDELSEQEADRALIYICNLCSSVDTSKVIISCRSGNLNRIRAKQYINFIEYKIKYITEKQITKYFTAKKDANKSRQLVSLNRQNPQLVKDVTDVFLVKLLWDTINELSENSTAIDLFDKKIQLLLTDPDHKKYLCKLNLLNPKDKEIYSLNQSLSLEFQRKFQFRILHKELQEIIMTHLPRIDYQAVNDIVNYLSDLFFDDSSPSGEEDEGNRSYAYQHRRYQEFFFAQKAKEIYEIAPKSLRDLKVFSNPDFFYDLFLKYLKKEYLKSRDLPRLLELSLINVYSGRHRGWGADDPYYINSSEFIPAIACQQDVAFEQLLEDESLDLKSKILVDVGYVKSKFDVLKKDKKNWEATDYLKSVRSSGISGLINKIPIFHKYNKNKFVAEIATNIRTLYDLYEKTEFDLKLDPKDPDRNVDPFWTSIEEWIYYRVSLKDEVLKKLYKTYILKHYNQLSDNKQFPTTDSNKERFIKSFINACLSIKPNEITTLVDSFDNLQWLVLLETLLDFDYTSLIFDNDKLANKIKTFVKNYSDELNEETYFLAFYKKIYNLPLTETNLKFCDTQLVEYIKKRHFDWGVYKIPTKFALISYALGKNSFVHEDSVRSKHVSLYYSELQLFSLIFNGYISLLQRKTNIYSLIRNYKIYVSSHDNYGQGLHLRVDISFFWSYIFKFSHESIENLQLLKNSLFTEENNLILLSFYQKLIAINRTLFNNLVNESELKPFEDELLSWKEDYPSYIDRCFYLSQFYSTINAQKSLSYVAKGINDGILRHGWRKDPIVSYDLINGLGILYKNNYCNKESLTSYAKKIFTLALKVTDITDGAVTWRGPYNLVDLISKYDLELAIYFKNKLIEHDGGYNFNNSVVTSILLAKVNLGIELSTIEESMNEYRSDYDYEDKPNRSSFEEKLKVYMALSESDLYSSKQQKAAFEKAYTLVNETIEKHISYFLNKSDFEDELSQYARLCISFHKDNNLPESKESGSSYKRKQGMPESEFTNKTNEAKTKRSIRLLIKKLSDYEQGILLTKFESWYLLVKKTLEIEGNINLITNYLKDQNYPHTDFYSSNSKYLYFCVASALRITNAKDYMLDYLFENGGHDGFINLMRVYELNKDKDTCVKLFKHFYNFCKFLVY
jgi:hypothetical protein